MIAVAGDPADVALAGTEAASDTELVVLLGAAPAPAGADPDRCVRLLDGPVAGERSSAGDGRLVATAGDGLWRRAPWPAADALLAAPPPPADAGVLIVDPSGASELAARLAERGVPAQEAARLDSGRLLAAAVILFAGAPGEPLPAHAPAVLAAGRVLVVPRAEPSFGLLPAVDHLSYDDDVAAAQYADIAFTHGDAFESTRAMGRIAVRAHLASEVYRRWAVDLELGL
jgi:hypothetical protein